MEANVWYGGLSESWFVWSIVVMGAISACFAWSATRGRKRAAAHDSIALNPYEMARGRVPGPVRAGEAMPAFTLSCVAFSDGNAIPEQYTGDSADLSPPLRWSGVPEGTREFALICEDPDAPGTDAFVHWVIYNISPNTTALPEGMNSEKRLELPVRADQGVNSFGNTGYNGPLPPFGHGPHRYVFTLYALDTELALKPGATKGELLRAIRHHVLARARLVGIYERGGVMTPAA